MRRKIFTAALMLMCGFAVLGQQKTDTVIVSLGNTSKVVFTIQDRRDLDILRHYNFQDLFQDIFKKLEDSDTTASDSSREEVVVREEDWSIPTPENRDSRDDDEEATEWNSNAEAKRRVGRTWQSTNLDLGTNNYLTDRQFPDGSAPYTVRPWGSWYLGVTSTQRTRVGKNFFFEWGLGVSWYNFKFEDDNIVLAKTEVIEFAPDSRNLDYIKSKLSATFINISFVPILDFGDHGRKPRVWDGYGSEFRMGIGPYAGYRIGSQSKLVYNAEDGDREREKTKDSYYLNNLRYGARLQVGFRSTDFFLNYDFNELFASGRGPKLNAVSFGVIF
jgi:hypothetical protein